MKAKNTLNNQATQENDKKKTRKEKLSNPRRFNADDKESEKEKRTYNQKSGWLLRFKTTICANH